jgi:hypothetical protein
MDQSHNCHDEYTKIFYFNSLKYNLMKQNEYITFLLNNQSNVDLDIQVLKGMRELEFNTNYLTSYSNSYSNNISQLSQLKQQVDYNNELLNTIDSRLNDICQHNFIEDYVETGVEQEMKRIHYCEICHITTPT